jgi:SAM-dependent methyltransferase
MTTGKYRDRIYAAYAASKGSQASTTADLVQMRAIIHRLRDWLPSSRDATCLDIGSGDGLLISTLRGEGFAHCEGVDRSPDQVARALQVGVQAKLGDATEYLEANPAAYDLVTAMDVVEHLRKDELLRLLDAVFVALKPGGRLIIQTPNAGSPWGMKVRYGDLTHEIGLETESLGQALRVTGFGAIEARECEPFVHGPLSALRWLMWRCVHGLLWAWNVIETGSSCGSVYTRVFVAKADKPRNGA